MQFRLRTLLTFVLAGAIVGAFTLAPPIWNPGYPVKWPRSYDIGAGMGGIVGLCIALI